MKKISETFLDFIEPVLQAMGCPEPDSKEYDNVLKLCWTVWNAVIKNDVDGDPSVLKAIHHTIPAEYRTFIDNLVERKRKHFDQYQYYIGECEIRTKPDGSFSLYADARESSGLRIQ